MDILLHVKKFILKRIEETTESITAIEKELIKRPNDRSLMRSLRLKKENLKEDFDKLQRIKG